MPARKLCGHKTRPRLRHYLLANLRDVQVLLRQFRLTLLLFATLFVVGAAFFQRFYVDPQTGHRLGEAEALCAVFFLIFMQPTLPFPEMGFLRALYFIIPMLGLGVLGEGIVRFGVLLFNKQARLKEWQMALASTYSNHIVVCGMGRLGYRIVEQLLACGEEVVAVELDPDRSLAGKVVHDRVPVIPGDARSLDVLRSAGVARARAVIPCTENDLANLEIALNARELKPDIHVVLRMFDHELAKKVERGFGIPTAFSTSSLAAPAFAAAVSQTHVSPPIFVDDAVLHTAQISVEPGSRLAGRTVSQVEGEFDLSIILYQGKGKPDLHPGPKVVLRAGDRIVLFATLEVLSRFRRAM